MYVGKRETEEMLIDDFEFYIFYNVFPFHIKTRMRKCMNLLYTFLFVIAIIQTNIFVEKGSDSYN